MTLVLRTQTEIPVHNLVADYNMYPEFAAVYEKLQDGSTSPPEIRSVVKDFGETGMETHAEGSLNHERDLLGAIFREDEPVGAISERGSSGSPAPGERHGTIAEEGSREPQDSGVAEQTREAAKNANVTALLVKGSKKNKKSHARKQPKGHIPRPRNAFILFRKHITDNDLIPTSVEVKHQNISVVAAKMWAEAPPNVKAEFTEAARIEKEEHARLYPNYRYQPAYRRTDIVRRRVRKDPIEDQKCDAVANLLIQGASGNQLESEVKETLAQQAPEPVNPEQIKLVNKRGRRRRKDAPGELSKGAIRAQRAAARAKAMREQWMDTNLLLNMQIQTDPRAMTHKHAIARHQVMGIDYADEPTFMDGFDPAYEDGIYDDGYDLPYDAVLDQYEEDLPYPHQPHDLYQAEEFTPMEPHHSMNFTYHRGPMQGAHAEDPPIHPAQHGYVPMHPTHLDMPEPPLGFAEYADPIYQSVGLDGGLTHRDMLSPQAANHQSQPLQEPMLAGYPPVLPEHEEVDYTYQPFDSPPRVYEDDFAQVDPFLASLGEEFQPTGRPADIIAGRWAQQVQQDEWIASDDPAVNVLPEHDATLKEPEEIPTRGHKNNQALGMFSTVDNDVLPSEGIDFGEQPRLFDEIWEREPPILPLDPDMDDYQQAVREQDEMEMLTAR